MPVTVGEFYEDLRVVLARGAPTDERLKVWSRVALRFLEREFTFDYMRNTYLLLMLPGSRYFDFSTVDPPIPLKEIEALGYYGQDGGMMQFKRRNVASSAGINGALDSTYRVAQSKIIFEGTTTPPGLTTETVTYPILLHNSVFTEWPTDPDATHPVLEIAEDLMKYQILMSSTPSLRKHSELQGWKFMRDEAITGLRRLEDEKALEDDVGMEYWGGHTGNMFSSASEAIASICGLYDVPNTFGLAGIYLISCGMGVSEGVPEGPFPPPPEPERDEVMLESGEGLLILEDGTGTILIESSL